MAIKGGLYGSVGLSKGVCMTIERVFMGMERGMYGHRKAYYIWLKNLEALETGVQG